MFLDPPAPKHLPDLVEAFAQTVRAVIELAHGCSADDLAKPTECPGWTVHDQISHVVGVEAWLAGLKDPRVTMPHYGHVRNDFGRRIEYAVEVRRARTGPEVVTELESVLTQRLSTLRSPALTDLSVIPGPFGPDQSATVLALRTFDVWAHEQDIRSALGRPGNLDSAAAAVFVSSVLRMLPRLIAKGAGIEPGHRVVVDIDGPGSLVAREGVRVEVDDHGRPRGHAMSTDEAMLTYQGRYSDDVTRPSDLKSDHELTTISLSTEAFTRRAAGRRSVSDTEYRVVGDEAVARRVLEALVATP